MWVARCSCIRCGLTSHGKEQVANMTASSLALPGTKKVPAPSNAQAAGPQLIPGQAAIVSGFQYSIKLAGKNSDVEWMVRLFLANSNSRGQAAIAAPGFGAVVQVRRTLLAVAAVQAEPVSSGGVLSNRT